HAGIPGHEMQGFRDQRQPQRGAQPDHASGLIVVVVVGMPCMIVVRTPRRRAWHRQRHGRSACVRVAVAGAVWGIRHGVFPHLASIENPVAGVESTGTERTLPMKIGELARATLTPLETIRFYEREGLLPPTGRTDGNYRIYGQEHVERLTLIRHCRTLDMALDEIRALLRFKASPQENCAGVNELLDEHIGHVAQRIRE